MVVLVEHVELPADEPLRLLSWRGGSEELVSLESYGRTRPARGVGGRWHSHPEIEFTIVTRGRGMRYVGDVVEPFGAMDCVLLGGNLPHCWMERGPYDGYVLQFRLLSGQVWHLSGAASLHELIKAAARGLFFERRTAREALRLIRHMAAAPPLVRAGVFVQLLGHLHACLSGAARPLVRAGLDLSPGATARPRLEALVPWMLENFIEPLRLEEAVERAAMSRATFSRQFKRHTGKTFVQFLSDARLAQAHQLLTTTRRPVSDIAYASGFGSLSQFNAAFRARYGSSPNALRHPGGVSKLSPV